MSLRVFVLNISNNGMTPINKIWEEEANPHERRGKELSRLWLKAVEYVNRLPMNATERAMFGIQPNNHILIVAVEDSSPRINALAYQLRDGGLITGNKMGP